MKNLRFVAVLFAAAFVAPIPTMAAVDISVNISLPPPIVFEAPPDVVVIPDTDDVYVDPDIDIDLFFWNGWWWRLWEGHWYRSRYYDRGWRYYSLVPTFYYDVDPGWRGYYRDHNWYGHRWDYERIPNRRLQQNWRNWHNDRYWERQNTWGVQGYRPRPQQQRQELRQQRQREYQQRPEAQQYRQQGQQERRQPQAQQPQQPQRQQPQERVRPPQREERGPQAQQPQRAEPRGEHEGREEEHRR